MDLSQLIRAFGKFKLNGQTLIPFEDYKYTTLVQNSGLNDELLDYILNKAVEKFIQAGAKSPNMYYYSAVAKTIVERAFPKINDRVLGAVELLAYFASTENNNFASGLYDNVSSTELEEKILKWITPVFRIEESNGILRIKQRFRKAISFFSPLEKITIGGKEYTVLSDIRELYAHESTAECLAKTEASQDYKVLVDEAPSAITKLVKKIGADEKKPTAVVVLGMGDAELKMLDAITTEQRIFNYRSVILVDNSPRQLRLAMLKAYKLGLLDQSLCNVDGIVTDLMDLKNDKTLYERIARIDGNILYMISHTVSNYVGEARSKLETNLRSLLRQGHQDKVLNVSYANTDIELLEKAYANDFNTIKALAVAKGFRENDFKYEIQVVTNENGQNIVLGLWKPNKTVFDHTKLKLLEKDIEYMVLCSVRESIGKDPKSWRLTANGGDGANTGSKTAYVIYS
jgi:hypothetical protein